MLAWTESVAYLDVVLKWRQEQPFAHDESMGVVADCVSTGNLRPDADRKLTRGPAIPIVWRHWRPC